MLEDINPLYRSAGVGGRHSVLIMTDKEIKDESFLEYLNIFLNTGELPNLFARDETDAILLVGSNPRWEAPVLNTRIRKRYLLGGLAVGVIGEALELTYRYDYLGAGTDALAAIQDISS